MAVMEDFGGYSGGIYEHEGPESEGDINHQVMIVGYNDDPGYWICKNSWGKRWGERGFFRIFYGGCQIEQRIAYVDCKDSEMHFPFEANAKGPYYSRDKTVTFDASADIELGMDIEGSYE